MNADDFARLIKRSRKRNNWYTGLCPGHNDKNPSLVWTDAKDRPGIKVKCFAGCDLKQICGALNMEAREIYEGISVSRPVWKDRRGKGQARNKRRKKNLVEREINKKWDSL